MIFEVSLTFEGDLRRFLRRPLRHCDPVRVPLTEKTSVKDIIESCGVPHTEVDLIVRRGEPAQALAFACTAESPVALAVIPAPAPDELLPAAPRLQPRTCERFVADGHLAALARHLRLLGIDVLCDVTADDALLLQRMMLEQRALLTRDRRLLMHSVVRAGYCPRSDDPEAQAREVMRRFHVPVLTDSCWSRCLRCNGLLRQVAKRDVRDALAGEPLTLRYHDEFLRCAGCGKIYWQGSHYQKLRQRLAKMRDEG